MALHHPIASFSFDPSTRSHSQYSSIPPEEASKPVFGCLIHLGPILVSTPIFFLIGPSFTAACLATFPPAFLAATWAQWASFRKPSTNLSPLNSAPWFLSFLWNVFGKGLVIGAASLGLLHWLARFLWPYQSSSLTLMSMIIALALCDLWYYALHRWVLHGTSTNPIVRWGRKQHAVHHSITDLDFWRGNQGSIIDNGFMSFPLPLAICTYFMHLDWGATFFVYMNLISIQITHHVNHSFDLGAVRHVIIDSHTHRIHHCIKGRLVNFAVVFSIWDRLFGSYYEDFSLNPSVLHARKIPLPILSPKEVQNKKRRAAEQPASQAPETV